MISQNYHLLGMKPSRGLLTFVDRGGSPRYMCFTKEAHARECKQFLCEYLKQYDRWPHMDFSAGDVRFLTDDRTDHDIVVHTFSERELDFIAMYSGCAMMHVDAFGYDDPNDASVTGTIEFDGRYIDPVLNRHMFTIQLETSLKL
jgi:hypothetical protein